MRQLLATCSSGRRQADEAKMTGAKVGGRLSTKSRRTLGDPVVASCSDGV